MSKLESSEEWSKAADPPISHLLKRSSHYATAYGEFLPAQDSVSPEVLLLELPFLMEVVATQSANL
jgi:hypothetical protein